MTTVAWAQLTPGQQALLDKLARALLAGGEWVRFLEPLGGISRNEYYNLLDEYNLIEWHPLNMHYEWRGDRITAAGLAVWQQGQAASAPRSVWVAKCGNDIISVNDADDNARHTCCIHAGVELVWEHGDILPDGTRRMSAYHSVYSVEEWRVLL